MERIIVIDDDRNCRETVRRALVLDGHEVELAAEGEGGLRLCRAHPPDLVITDLFMPGMEGIETIRALRGEFPDVGIIAVSGSIRRGAGDLLTVALRLGAQATLDKPFDADVLLVAVRSVLASSGV